MNSDPNDYFQFKFLFQYFIRRTYKLIMLIKMIPVLNNDRNN